MSETALVQAWRELLASYHSCWCALDRALRDGHELGASEFEVLDHLVETTDACGQQARRMQELGTSVQLSQSALSRVVARLEKDGLVSRTMCDDDRRGIFVVLTDAGRARHAAAAITHRAVLANQLTPAPAAPIARAS